MDSTGHSDLSLPYFQFGYFCQQQHALKTKVTEGRTGKEGCPVPVRVLTGSVERAQPGQGVGFRSPAGAGQERHNTATGRAKGSDENVVGTLVNKGSS